MVEIIGILIEPAIFLLIGAIFFAVGLRRRKNFRRFEEEAIHTTAKVMKYENEIVFPSAPIGSGFADDKMFSTNFTPILRFSVNGTVKRVRGKLGYGANIQKQIPVGSTVDICYPKGDPENFKFKGRFDDSLVFVIGGVALFLFGVYLLIQGFWNF